MLYFVPFIFKYPRFKGQRKAPKWNVKKSFTFLTRKYTENSLWENLGIDWRTILEYIIRK
jgi:hypothetical protein